MMRALTAVVVAAVSIAWPAAPPAPPSTPATDDYFGHEVVDPYRNFEHLDNPAVLTFLRQQAGYTDDVLAKLGPAREAIRADVSRLNDAGSAVSGLASAGRHMMYLERPSGSSAARLMVADATGRAPRVLLDPEALAENAGSKVHLEVSNVQPSPDGKFVAIGLVPGGAESDTHTRIVRVADGRLLPEDFPRTYWGATGWSRDDKAIFYNPFPKLRPGESVQDRELRSIVYRHTLGTTTPDIPVFGFGVDPKVRFAPTDFPFVLLPPVSRYAFGYVFHGTQPGEAIYVAPVDTVLRGGRVPWRKIADSSDGVYNFDVYGSTIYMLSFKNASRYKIVALDVSRAGQTARDGTIVVPPSDVVVQQVGVAQDGVYVRGILGGLANLRKLPFNPDHSVKRAIDVPLPFDGTLQEFATDPLAPGAILGLVSWTEPLSVYALDPRGALKDTRILKPPNIDTSEYTSLETKSTSADGTLVPLSIVMRKGTKLDGSHPTYIEAYGAYGDDIDPYFLGARFAWLDQGGVWAVAHVRGGGEYGEEWHRAGKGPMKMHTIDDAIGAARYLVAQRYTSPDHLAIAGTGAGGIVVGGVIDAHPELFAAALDVAGVTDPLRREAADPNGAVNAHEDGSVKTEAGFKSLYAMDAYQHVIDGQPYPAVMAVTGINDQIVAPWQPAKFAARLQAASASGRPVLLRVDFDSGDARRTASREQTIDRMSDEFSFLLWQCGDSLFATIPQHISR